MSDTEYVSAGEDLSARQYHAINVAGTLAADADGAYGILQNKPSESGRDAASLWHGPSYYRAGGGDHARGNLLTVSTSGWLTVATSGQQIVGRCRSAVNSGGIAEGIFNFASPGFTPG